MRRGESLATPNAPREFWRLSRASRESIREVAGVAYAGLNMDPSGHKPVRGDRLEQVHNAIFGGDEELTFAADAALRGRDGSGRENGPSRDASSQSSARSASAGSELFWRGGGQHDRRGGRHQGRKDRPDRDDNPGDFTPPAALEDPTVYLSGGGDLWESSTSPAFMGLYRTGDLSQSLTVNVAMSGTATEGVDYQNVPDTVTFNAYQSSVPLPIYSINDAIREGDETITATLQAGAGYGVGTPSTATITLRDDEPFVNIVMDTNDSGAIDAGDDPTASPLFEETAPGAYVMVNVTDDNGNFVPDYEESPFLNSGGTPIEDFDLVPANVGFDMLSPLPIDYQNYKVDFTYSGDGQIALWRTRTKQTAVVLGTQYTIGSAGFFPGQVFVEALSPGFGQLTLNLRAANGQLVHSDKVAVSKIQGDLDVDTNNSGGIHENNGSGGDDDRYETAAPGKIVFANWVDKDSDGISDFADGYNHDGVAGNSDDLNAGAEFNAHYAELKLHLPAPINLATARLRLIYDASDPASVSADGLTPAAGDLRVWTQPLNVARSGSSILAGTPGHFVPSGEYTAAQLLGGSRDRTLYLEGISQASLETLRLEIDPAGTGRWRVADSAVATSVYAYLRAYRPQTEGPGYNAPFQRHAVTERYRENVGAGIRRNGDNDDNDQNPVVPDLTVTDTEIAGENDLIELTVHAPILSGIEYFIRRDDDVDDTHGDLGSGANIHVWAQANKAGPILTTNEDWNLGAGTVQDLTRWVEWVSMDPDKTESRLELVIKTNTAIAATDDKTPIEYNHRFYPFNSIVVVLGGEYDLLGDVRGPDQLPSDPPAAGGGMFHVALRLFRDHGYDVHMYEEDAVEGDGEFFPIRDADPEIAGQGEAYDAVRAAVNFRGVSQVAIFGYSHGGGSTYDLAFRLSRNSMAPPAGVPALTDINNAFDLPFSAYVDGIQNSTDTDPDAETRRPLGTDHHMNYHQEGQLNPLASDFDHGLDGAELDDAQPGDFYLNVETTEWGADAIHSTVDDFAEVRIGLEEGVRNHVDR